MWGIEGLNDESVEFDPFLKWKCIGERKS